MELFKDSPTPGFLMFTDEAVTSFITSMNDLGDTPLSQDQRAMVILLITAAVFPKGYAVGMARAMLVLLTEGYQNMVGHLMLESLGIS